MEAPDPLISVESFQSSASSHPGPEYEYGEGVFQIVSAGKYPHFMNDYVPDSYDASSHPSRDVPNEHDDAFSVPLLLRHSPPSSSVPVPGCTPASIMEAPDPLISVEPFLPATCSHPGPEYEHGDGVFRNVIAGKYNTVLNNSCAEMCIASSSSTMISCQPFGYRSCCPYGEASTGTIPHRTSLPGRIVESTLEAPGTSASVVPAPACAHHSRLGPDGSCSPGVFQTALAGKYPHNSVPSVPDTASISRRPDVASTSVTPHPSCNVDVNVYYQNVGGINSDVADYRIAVSDLCYDIIVLTETWLDSRTLSHQVFGSDYEVFRCDRNTDNSRKATGGGVLVAVSSRLKARAVENRAWISLEQLWTAIKLGNRTLYLCALYIPPDRVRERNLIDIHCQSVFSILEMAKATDEVIVFGDFNLPGISWKKFHNGFLYPDINHSAIHSNASFLLDNYSSATLSQINHVTNQNNRSLDLCFVSVQDVAPSLGEAPSPLVKAVLHHPPLHVAIKTTLGYDFDITPAAVYYDFRKADHRSIANLLSNFDWGDILDNENLEISAQSFSNVLSYVIDRHVPKKLHLNSSRPPWQTSELRQLKARKRAALKKFTKRRTLSLQQDYVRINHVYKRVANRCYLQYQRRIQRKLKSRPKDFWKFVKEQRREAGLPSSMTFNGNVASSPQEICKLFAEKFASVFIEETLTDEDVEIAANNTPLTGQSLSRIQIDEAAITRASSLMKPSLNPGPDGIPSAFLKTQLANLMTPLLHVFRLSVSVGAFPSCWKLASMFPVHKKGSKRNVDNYRGITLLGAVPMLFELVVMEPLFAHCKPYISTDQHGFFSGRSTVTNLLCLTSDITDSMSKRAQTDVIYTDLTAAFDKLNHRIAIAKLGRLGVNGSLLEWFRSYLTGRYLAVGIGDCQSPVFEASSGIPQGSHLGPLIFLIYFNDVNSVIKGPRLSYADDLKLYLLIRSIADCRILQSQLDAFANWCTLNRMVVNPSKCSVISFSRKKEPILFKYGLQGTEIERVSEIKDLGVILDSQLTFKQHLSYVVSKASSILGFIFRIAKDFEDIYCLKSLYCSLSRSVLEYCSVIWNPHYNNGVERIESVQRRFLRFALRRLPWTDPFRLPSYESRCQLINLERLSVRRDTARAMVVADTLTGRIDCPSLLEQININVRPRALRNNVMLRLPLQRNNYSMFGAIGGLQRLFNRVAALFDFNLSRQLLRRSFSLFFFSRNV